MSTVYNVVGQKKVDYISKKTNKQVQGLNVYTLYEDKFVEGYNVEEMYLSKNVIEKSGYTFDDLKIDCNFTCLYNKFGNVEQIELV